MRRRKVRISIVLLCELVCYLIWSIGDLALLDHHYKTTCALTDYLPLSSSILVGFQSRMQTINDCVSYAASILPHSELEDDLNKLYITTTVRISQGVPQVNNTSRRNGNGGAGEAALVGSDSDVSDASPRIGSPNSDVTAVRDLLDAVNLQGISVNQQGNRQGQSYASPRIGSPNSDMTAVDLLAAVNLQGISSLLSSSRKKRAIRRRSVWQLHRARRRLERLLGRPFESTMEFFHYYLVNPTCNRRPHRASGGGGRNNTLAGDSNSYQALSDADKEAYKWFVSHFGDKLLS